MKFLKKALLIGINYKGTSSELSGCINDTRNLSTFLIKNKYFQSKQIRIMTDNSKPFLKPTKKNILRQLNVLLKYARRNRKKKILLFVSYSGHGSYLYDTNGDEQDGRDEVICPIDYEKRGFISDDLIKSRFINKLPRNVKIVFLMDACHSGTICDFRYEYMVTNKRRNINRRQSKTACTAVMISGCRDDQYSSDAYIKNQYQGAMTASFIANFNDKITYYILINKMRSWLRKKRFDQIPQLSAGRPINVKKNVLLTYYDK